MIPNDVEEFGTDGERVFFNFLRSVAKPNSRYIAWYLPDIKDREPDFLLYCEDVGPGTLILGTPYLILGAHQKYWKSESVRFFRGTSWYQIRVVGSS